MHKFLVQQVIDDMLCQSIFSEAQLISYLDMSDSCECEYKIFDISVFGKVKEVFSGAWKLGCVIEVVDSEGNVVVIGYGTDY